MSKPLVVILMGSKADLEHSTKIAEACHQFGLETAMRIGSAHKTAKHTLAILHGYEADPRPKVYITVAGRSNALSGFADGAVSAPVIACPPDSDLLARVDIFSSLRMPSGIAPAVVLEPANAALLAAKIMGLVDAKVRDEVQANQKRAQEKTIGDDAKLSQEDE
ncbi:MAG TPA: AIR carboxylase family protein [Anaerolineales bacterium]|jgi:phosphoribosylaminoimidazole carboxylase PurE protein|nr:AIR carboxylase family protein [Anaerolineales bacterium]